MDENVIDNLQPQMFPITFNMRCMIEMLNNAPGEAMIMNRLKSKFNLEQVSLQTKNVKRGNQFAAKAMVIATVDKDYILKEALNIKQAMVDTSEVVINTRNDNKDSNNQITSTTIKIHTIKLVTSTSTFAVEADIVPRIDSAMTTEYFNKFKELVITELNLATKNLADFIGLCTNAKFNKVSHTSILYQAWQLTGYISDEDKDAVLNSTSFPEEHLRVLRAYCSK